MTAGGYSEPRRYWIDVNKPLTWRQRWRALFGLPFTMYGQIHRVRHKALLHRWSIEP